MVRSGPKHAFLMGFRLNSTSVDKVLSFVYSRLETGEKFFIVTPNPEIILMAKNDWLLRKALEKSDLAVPDGIGLAMAYKFLNMNNYKGHFLRLPILLLQGLFVGLAVFFDRKWLTEELSIIKGRELFMKLAKLADERKLRVYLFGGENGEQEKTEAILSGRFKNAVFKTYHVFPKYNRKGQPASADDRKLHKKVLGNIKLFEPDLIFVALGCPRQEKWILRNFFRLKAVGAMAVGGSFNYVAGNMAVPPRWMEKYGLEWIWRLITDPKRYKRILNAWPIFPWKVFIYKLRK